MSNSGNSNISLNPIEISKIQETLIQWGNSNYSFFPWRSTTNSFHSLIAEIMLQRTKAEQVVPVFLKFVSKYSSAKDVSLEDPKSIMKILKPLGLKWRAKKIVELSNKLSKANEKIPETLEELIQLPGIGSYAAAAFLSFNKNIRSPIIDSNVVRLWSRIFGLQINDGTRRSKIFLKIAEEITPITDSKNFNYALLDLCRNVCKPKPLCNKCPISNFCKYYENDRF